jgi:hypothetical protein
MWVGVGCRRSPSSHFGRTNPNFLNENNEPTNHSYHFLAGRPAGAAFLVPEGRSD